MTARHPARWQVSTASIVSVSVPIWFNLTSRALAAFSLIARRTRSGFVTNRSSPTIWIRLPSSLVMSTQLSQSSCASPSSMDTIGYWSTHDLQNATICSPVSCLPSLRRLYRRVSSSKSSDAAGSNAIPTCSPAIYPAFSMAVRMTSTASLFAFSAGAYPPSSPTKAV